MSTDPKVVIATSIPPAMKRDNDGQPFGPEYQDLCVQSWMECGFRVLSINDREEIELLAERYPQVEFIATDRNASALTGRKNPYIADLLRALAEADAATVGIINSDILFQPSPAWNELLPLLKRGVSLVCARQDTNSLLFGALRSFFFGLDCFFFKREVAAELAADAKPYAMGVPWWDYWFPLALIARGHDVLLIDRPAIVHLEHPTAYSDGSARRMTLQFARSVVNAFNGRPGDIAPPVGIVHDICRALLAANDAGRNHEVNALLPQMGEVVACNLIPFLRNNRLQFKSKMQVELPDASTDILSPSTVFRRLEERCQGALSFKIAGDLARQERRAEAEVAYKEALAKLPNDPDVAFEAANFYFQNEKASFALPLYQRAVTLRPDDGRYLAGLGGALGATGRRDEGLAHIERGIQLAPDNSTGYVNLILTSNDRRRIEEGFKRFASALTDLPDMPRGPEWYFRVKQKFLAATGKPPLQDYYGQRGEDALLDEFFGRKREGFFVDIGAFDGVHLSNSYFFERCGWSGICVEASPQYYELCATNRPRTRCVLSACGAHNGKATFRIERGGLFSGLQPDEIQAAKTFEQWGVFFEGFQDFETQTISLDVLLSDHVGPIDFISIDVSGSEIGVLNGFDFSRHRPRVFLVDANSGEKKESLDTCLLQNGYRHARTINTTHFYVADEGDWRTLRAIVVSAKLAKPPHPLGEDFSLFGYPFDPYVFYPAEVLA